MSWLRVLWWVLKACKLLFKRINIGYHVLLTEKNCSHFSLEVNERHHYSKNQIWYFYHKHTDPIHCMYLKSLSCIIVPMKFVYVLHWLWRLTPTYPQAGSDLIYNNNKVPVRVPTSDAEPKRPITVNEPAAICKETIKLIYLIMIYY